jgi:hypothetical protein
VILWVKESLTEEVTFQECEEEAPGFLEEKDSR